MEDLDDRVVAIVPHNWYLLLEVSSLFEAPNWDSLFVTQGAVCQVPELQAPPLRRPASGVPNRTIHTPSTFGCAPAHVLVKTPPATRYANRLNLVLPCDKEAS